MKYFIFILALFAVSPAEAQFTRANLQAAGLTCAMCTRAINKAIEKLPFVESVNPDIKSSSFDISFKKNSKVDPDAIKKAVEEAGFSVAKLSLTGQFESVKIANDKHIEIDGKNFHFLNVNAQTLSGEKTLVLTDKNFLTQKEFKKYSTATKMSCLQTGKAENCCTKEGIDANKRVYHVTI
ncbi:MAG: heavy-metal-associated domain-containing protein [Chitinophagaceae bacterium]|nr:heavy-metal-associated domain-containing protein [Chitinophagaceae bacterium]